MKIGINSPLSRLVSPLAKPHSTLVQADCSKPLKKDIDPHMIQSIYGYIADFGISVLMVYIQSGLTCFNLH